MAREMANVPQDIQDRLSKTPAERKAELLARRQARLDALTPQQRQKVQDRIDRISAVPVNKRPSLMQGLRLGSTARAIKARIEGGMSLQDVIDALDTDEKAAVDWLVDQVVAGRSN